MAKAKSESKQLPGRTGEVDLEAAIELGHVRVRIEDLLGYTEGALIELATTVDDPVVLLVGGEPFATGEVVTVRENFGMRVKELVNR